MWSLVCFFFSSRRRHTRWNCDWSSDVCSSDLAMMGAAMVNRLQSAPSPAEEKAAAELNWLTDFNAAKERARTEKKLVLINFTGSDWCPPCMRLRSEERRVGKECRSRWWGET